MLVINIAEVSGSRSAITRQIARDLFEIIITSSDNTIALDFANIDFSSRSFFSELHGLLASLGTSKQVEIRNLNAHLYKLMDALNVG